jgi:hypothetical protein
VCPQYPPKADWPPLNGIKDDKGCSQGSKIQGGHALPRVHLLYALHLRDNSFYDLPQRPPKVSHAACAPGHGSAQTHPRARFAAWRSSLGRRITVFCPPGDPRAPRPTCALPPAAGPGGRPIRRLASRPGSGQDPAASAGPRSGAERSQALRVRRGRGVLGGLSQFAADSKINLSRIPQAVKRAQGVTVLRDRGFWVGECAGAVPGAQVLRCPSPAATRIQAIPSKILGQCHRHRHLAQGFLSSPPSASVEAEAG